MTEAPKRGAWATPEVEARLRKAVADALDRQGLSDEERERYDEWLEGILESERRFRFGEYYQRMSHLPTPEQLATVRPFRGVNRAELRDSMRAAGLFKKGRR